jgi:tRNA (Thr-GGU) A37 N-methylase
MELEPVATVESPLKTRAAAPKQGDEGAPEAWLLFVAHVADGLLGVVATRSPDRPNPIGVHRVRVLELDGLRMRVSGLEALDGTPVVDVKPVLRGVAER